ncbi:MAG: hypothetical protein Q8M92_08625, partial [Candidatus Subteraquimicrobiales bacterium]|nr:hypothetical protein [Candidatus Subteraquimicrobiales bacterium]
EPFPLMGSRASIAFEGNMAQVQNNQLRYIGEGAGVNGVLIEESATNLLPSAPGLALETPYTSGTLNGTYTLKVYAGSGTVTLSGGASGTVTPGNHITFTVSNATVTFTPSGGTPAYLMLVMKAYPLSWMPGGTTRQADQLYIPVEEVKKFINLNEGCIEVLHTPTLATKQSPGYLFLMQELYNKNRLDISTNNGSFQHISANNDNVLGDAYATNKTIIENVLTSLDINYTKNILSHLINGNLNGMGVSNSPKLPEKHNSMMLGFQCSGFLHHVIFSEPRTVEDRVNRQRFAQANGYYQIDDKVQAFIPLESGLVGYRRTGSL